MESVIVDDGTKTIHERRVKAWMWIHMLEAGDIGSKPHLWKNVTLLSKLKKIR